MICSITDFGAYTSDLLMTEPIQAAIDACFKAGGGEVIVPEGIFRTGGIRLRSHVTLHLLSGAILEGSEDYRDYFGWMHDEVEPVEGVPEDPYHAAARSSSTPLSAWSNGLIRILNAEDVAVIGEKYSYIDGRNVYDPNGEANFRGPHAIAAWQVSGLRLEGYTLRNSANWAHNIVRSEDITAKNVTVYGGHDGFDVFLCHGVLVDRCRFYTGDDCIAGFGSVDVTVRDSALHSACSAIRFGGTHVLIENCETKAPAEFAFRGSISQQEKELSRMPSADAWRGSMTAFLYYCDTRFGPLPQNSGDIVIRRCRFENTNQLFNMDFGRHMWCCNAPLTSITFEDCELTGMNLPIYIHGDPGEPIDFTLTGTRISAAPDHSDMVFADVEGCRTFRMKDVTLSGFADPVILDRDCGSYEFEVSDRPDIRKAEPGKSELKGH